MSWYNEKAESSSIYVSRKEIIFMEEWYACRKNSIQLVNNPRIRITGCAETRLFTLFSGLAQAEKWTKTKGFCCSCNLYFLVPTFDSCFGKHSFGLKTLWDFCLILNQLNCKIIVLIKLSIWDKDIHIQYTVYTTVRRLAGNFPTLPLRSANNVLHTWYSIHRALSSKRMYPSVSYGRPEVAARSRKVVAPWKL